MKKNWLIQAGALILGYTALSSQANPPTTVSLLAASQTQKELTASIDAYFQVYGRPTVYLMIDKPLYQPGESIWFRVDLRHTSSLLPIHKVKGTAELLDPKGASIGKKKLFVKDGVASNDFMLEEDAPGGEYTLRFTGEDGSFERRIVNVASYEAPRLKKSVEFLRKSYGPGDEVLAAVQVSHATGESFAQKPLTAIVTIDEQEVSRTKINTDKDGNAIVKYKLPNSMVKGDGLLTILAEDGGVTESIQRRIPIFLKEIKLDLFPEGGSLVEGLSGRVYFSATNSMGKPVDVEGRVVDSDGREVTTFRSTRDGLGRFAFTPAAGKRYYAEITKPERDSKRSYDLPRSELEGCSIISQDDFKSSNKKVTVEVSCTKKQSIVAEAVLREKSIAAATFSVEERKPAALSLEVGDAQGALRLTLFDEKKNPLAERLIYRGAGQGMKIALTPERAAYSPRDKVTLGVLTTDANNKPIEANVGLSVVDDTVLSFADDKSANLLAHIFLEKALPSVSIEDPNFYFSDKPEAAEALDLLMGTKGYRRFDWVYIQRGDLDYDTFSDLNDKCPAEPETINNYKDTDGCPEIDTDSDGVPDELDKCPKEGETFNGYKDDDGCPEKDTDFDGIPDGKDKCPSVEEDFNGLQDEDGCPDDLDYDGITADKDKCPKSAEDFNGYQDKDGCPDDLDYDGILAKDKCPKQAEDFNGYKDEDGCPDDPDYDGIFGFQDKCPYAPEEVNGKNDDDGCPETKGFKWEQPVAFGAFGLGLRGTGVGGGGYGEGTIGLGSVGSIGKGSGSGSGFGYGSAKAPEKREKKAFSLAATKRSTLIALAADGKAKEKRPIVKGEDIDPATGYSRVRVFPQPEYKAGGDGVRDDFRETIYWNPQVKTGKDGKASVSFYLSDAVTSFRATAEGFSAKGLAGRGEALLSSKLPLSLDVVMPLEVSEGDQISLPVTLTNETNKAVSASIEATFGDSFLVEESPARTVELKAKEKRAVFYTLQVVGKGGEGEILLSADAGGLKDEVFKKIKVVPLGFPAEQSLSGTLNGKVKHEIDLSNAVKGTSDAVITLYPTPLASMVKGAEGILREPSGCFEQTSSSNYPNVMVMQYMQANDVADKEILTRAQGLMTKGYKKLVSFETKEKGYEWFGGTPAHEALTAYGLMEFVDMAGLDDDVDEKMIARTVEWLMSRRDGKGGYLRDSKALDSFGRAGEETTNAYITWALSEAKKTKGLERELEYVRKLGQSSKDPYIVALAANTLLNVDKKSAGATTLAKSLASLQDKTGKFPGAKESITKSGGSSLVIESTSLSILALIKASPSREYEANIQAGVEWLNTQRSGWGQYGNTQGTILSLKALSAFTEYSKSMPADGTVRLFINGRESRTFQFKAGLRDPIVFDGLSELLSVGQNTVELTIDSQVHMPYSIVASYRKKEVKTDPNVSVALTTSMAQREVKMGESVRMKASVKNIAGKGLPMTLVRLGLPGGLTSQAWQLKELRDKGLIGFYETGAREVILYFRDMAPDATIEIDLDLLSRVPGTFTAPPSSAYLYYTNEFKSWAPATTITVKQ